MKEWLSDALDLEGNDTPFPWQQELLKRFTEARIPRALDIPTGLGKTAVMAIWLVARAHGAAVPRRLLYVVDRRAVVDQATEVAMALRVFVDRTPEVKAKLGLTEERSLPISTLRGQFVDNREWLEDPAAPAIIVGTVDMIGSRLLFEGYGVTRKMRPYHAGLLGADSLLVLDEAHLVPPFEKLLEQVAHVSALGPKDESLRRQVPRFELLSLSATGRTTGESIFRLTPDDVAHPVVRKRLGAAKSLRLSELESGEELESALTRLAWEVSGGGQLPLRCVVYCNRRDVAEEVLGALEKLAKGDKKSEIPVRAVDLELFVGARRVLERQEAKARLTELGFIAGSKVELTRPAFLVATSAAEVGVDLDADHMVCDLVAWERMVQRLGRVNRRGEGEATVQILIEPLPEKAEESDEIRYEAQQRVVASLRHGSDGMPSGSPHALLDLNRQAREDNALRANIEAATTPPPLHPALTRPTLDAWSMTSLGEHTGRPDVEPWLRGWVDHQPQTRVAWRCRLPVPEGRAPLQADLDRFFAAAPPHVSEILETETYRVADWLFKRVKRRIQAVEAMNEADATQARRRPTAFALDASGEIQDLWSLDDLDKLAQADKKVRDRCERSWRGRTLVIDASLGGLNHGLLDAKHDAAPRTADGEGWMIEAGTGAPVVRFRVTEVTGDAAAQEDADWRERERLPLRISGEGNVERWLVVEKWHHDASTEEDRSTSHPQALDEHEDWAAQRVARLAERLGLPSSLARVLRVAARLHDEGKRSARWQRAFHAPSDQVYAKTRGPVDVQLLDGYRHEFGSLPQAEVDPELRKLTTEQQDLVLHLIAAHHGFARPLIRTNGCEDAPPSALEVRARQVALRFLRLQDKWGPWGLAWVESLLRAADQQASRDNDRRDREEG